MKSIWESEPCTIKGKKLTENISRGVVIVGGGLAGILTAYKLSRLGYAVAIVEGGKVCSGVTKNTTAHITANQGYVYIGLDRDIAQSYFRSQLQAIAEFRDIVSHENIDCDFAIVDDHIFTINQPKKLKKLYQLFCKFEARATYLPTGQILGIDTLGCLTLHDQAMFHPIKFVNQLGLQNVEIFENTRVTEIDTKSKILYTESHQIQADKIIIATNYPISNLQGGYFLKLYKSQSYVLAVDSDVQMKGMYQSDIENGLTFRKYQDKVLIGGLDHRTGRVNHDNKRDRMTEIARQYFASTLVSSFWSANDVVTFDQLPMAGLFHKNVKDIYVITGFNKWGMTNSMICSTIVADLIDGKDNEFAHTFCPQRARMSIGSATMNALVSVNNLVIKRLIPPFKSYKKLKDQESDIVCCNGKKAVFKDNGKLFKSSPYCTHLGCQLQFNANTQTWDCCCHGSRFDQKGKIICGPAVKDLESSTHQCQCHNHKSHDEEP